jgi:hypothetical protein
VALEHGAQGVGDRANLARLFGEHVARAAGDWMDHAPAIQADRGGGVLGWWHSDAATAARPCPLRVHRLGRHALDARAQIAQALVDALVATVDLPDIADLAATFGAQRREQHRHAGADVR